MSNALQEFYTINTEKTIIEFALQRPDVFRAGRLGFDPAFMQGERADSDGADNRKVLQYICDYYDEYKEPPSRETIATTQGYVESLIGLPSAAESIKKGENLEWFKDYLTKFARHKLYGAAAMEIQHGVNDGNFAACHDYMDALRDFTVFAPTTGSNLLNDLGEFFEELNAQSEELVSTGWKLVDAKFGGGMLPGQLNLVVARTGAGKSLVLSNIAVNLAEQNKKVLLVSLEMPKHEMLRRVARMLTRCRADTNMTDEQRGKLRIALQNNKYRGNITVESMPNGTTPAEIESLLLGYKSAGVEFDALIVDYWDLAMPNDRKLHGKDVWIRDDKMAWDFKAMAARENVVFYTASQTNTGVKERKPGEMYDTTMIAGGQAKPRAIDTCIFLEKVDNNDEIKLATNQKKIPPPYEIKAYKLYFAKTRNSEGGAFETLGWDYEALRIKDLAVKVDGGEYDNDVPKPGDKASHENRIKSQAVAKKHY